MPHIKHILFPYDFSDTCAAAAPYIWAYARQFGARVTMFTAVPPVWDLDSGQNAALLVDHKLIQTRLEHVLEPPSSGIHVDGLVRNGDPATILAAFAHENQVDLIMLPTHGMGRFRTLLVGSVTAKVLHDADVPVWTAPHVEFAAALEHRSVGTVLCAIDSGAQTVPILKWAAQIACLAGAKLSAVHAVPSVTDLTILRSERELQESARLEAEALARGLMAEAGVEAPLRVVVGTPPDVIHDEALRTGADVLVIGRGLLAGNLGRLRSHVLPIISKSPCPVISV